MDPITWAGRFHGGKRKYKVYTLLYKQALALQKPPALKKTLILMPLLHGRELYYTVSSAALRDLVEAVFFESGI